MHSRILPIARITFLEALRQRFFGFLLVLALAMTLGSLPLKAIDFGNQELKFLADLGFGVTLLLGSVLAVVLPAQLLYAELDNRTALTLLAKPVGRSEFLLGKFLGAWAVLALFALAVTGLLAVILLLREPEVAARAARLELAAPELSLPGLAAHALLQVVRLGVVAALTLLLGSLARSFLYTVVVGSMAVLAGQLVWVAQEALQQVGQTATMRALLWTSTRLFPNLQSFNVGEALVLAPGTVEAGTLPALLLSGMAYLAVLLLLACLAFRRREI